MKDFNGWLNYENIKHLMINYVKIKINAHSYPTTWLNLVIKPF